MGNGQRWTVVSDRIRAMSRDYYDILGVAKEASADEIKKSYRKLAMQISSRPQPGRRRGGSTISRRPPRRTRCSVMSRKEGYTMPTAIRDLKNTGYSGPGTAEDIFSSINDLFGDLFGFGGRSRQRNPNAPIPGDDLRYDMEISFMDAVHGTVREVEVTKRETCWTCEGSGVRPGTSAADVPDLPRPWPGYPVPGFFPGQFHLSAVQWCRPDHYRSLQRLPWPGAGQQDQEGIHQDTRRCRHRGPDASQGRRGRRTPRRTVRRPVCGYPCPAARVIFTGKGRPFFCVIRYPWSGPPWAARSKCRPFTVAQVVENSGRNPVRRAISPSSMRECPVCGARARET